MSHPSSRQAKPLTRLTSGPWPILAVVVLALALRLINLSGRPLWYDEAFAVLYAEKPFTTMLYGTVTRVEGAAADVHPLFFYSTLHTWMLAAGQSPFAVRALSVLVGTATVVMAYLFARRLFNQRAGLAAAIIVAIAPFHIYYSQEARMYAMLGFAAVTTAYFFVRAWTGGGWGNWLAFAIFGTLTLYAHNLGFMFLAGLELWVLWAWLRPGAARWRNIRPFLLSHLLIIVLFAPWLAVVPSQFGKIQQAYWVEQPGVVKLIQTILIFHFAYDNQSLPGWLLPPALFFSLLILAIIAFELVRQHMASSSQQASPTPDSTLPARKLLPTSYSLLPTEPSPPGSCSLLLFLSLAPVLLTFLASQIRPVYIVRALLPAALMYYTLIAGVLVAGRPPRLVKWGLLLPSALIVAASLMNHYSYAQFPRPPFDEAAAYLRTHYQPADVIVHSNKLTFLPTHYYDRSLPQTFIADEPGSPSDTLAYPTQQALGLFATPDMAAATQGHERVWFVIFRRAIDEYRAAGYADHPYRAWLERHYTLVSVESFSDLEVYEYQSGLSPTAFAGLEVTR
jgi:4-amino-4-deoxy-L-arabinose transferase-like glycosyltransferase